MSARRRPPAANATVSVIVPTCNRSALLVEAVESVLSQSHRVHEIIVVDDGSDPSHRGVLDALVRRSPQIRAVALPSRGERSRARNEGLARATGDYVLFLDDDDLLDRELIAEGVREFARGAAVDVVVARGQRFGDVGPPHVQPLNPFWADSAADPDGRASAWMGVSSALRRELERDPVRVLMRCSAPINAFLVRREAIGETRFLEDLDYGEDLIFWLDLARKGCRFRPSPGGRAYVRRHNGNSPLTASTVIACQRARERVRDRGRHEDFLAAVLCARACWLGRHPDRWRQTRALVRYPVLSARYAWQSLVCLTFRAWLRAPAWRGAPAASTVIPSPLQAPASDGR
jgi:glycosyltransferase involved in cell wall biosynthesis